MIRFKYFPGGKSRVFTASYDDGTVHDRRLVEIFNHYGIKGTFHLNSGKLNTDGYLTSNEISELYQCHEIALHTHNHPYLTQMPLEAVVEEILRNRKELEQLCGYPVVGFSYPFGAYDEQVICSLNACGVRYSRTVDATGKFQPPSDWMRWNPTCRHRLNLNSCLESFLEDSPWEDMRLFYLWGHSYEFDQDHNWDLIENFCSRISSQPDTWFATNLEVYEYISALRNLRISADQTMIYNPSSIPVWFSYQEKPIKLDPGASTNLTNAIIRK